VDATVGAVVTRADLARWIESYERAWRTAGTEPIGELFPPAATYRAAPFDEPLRGLDAVAAFWEAERAAPTRSSSLLLGLRR
jgi:hypothetical protein